MALGIFCLLALERAAGIGSHNVPVHLAHPPLADEGGHVVVGESRADGQGHSQCRSYRRRSGQIIGDGRPITAKPGQLACSDATGTDSYGCCVKFVRRRRAWKQRIRTQE